jgi:hypothetical protein
MMRVPFFSHSLRTAEHHTILGTRVSITIKMLFLYTAPPATVSAAHSSTRIPPPVFPHRIPPPHSSARAPQRYVSSVIVANSCR